MNYPKDVFESVKAHLIKDQKKTQTTLASLQAQDPYSDTDRLVDNAASDTEAKEESSHERMEALVKELHEYLEDISKALERIEKGTYGKCMSCGNMIDTDRLGIKPTALYCVECEKKRSK